MNNFSIILPVRNGGEYVKECVESILTQTYPHFNLIVLDNNSNDGTKEWIESLKIDKINIYPSTIDLTINENWGRIVDVPKNEFMTLIGHDDVLAPNFLEEMNALINEYPDASLYQTHFNFIDENGDFVRKCKSMKSKFTAPMFIQGQFLQTLDSTGTGYVCRSIDYDFFGGISTSYPNLIYADYELWVKLTNLNYLAVSNACCFSYRLHNSTSKLTNGEDYQIAFFKYLDFLLNLRKKDKKIHEELVNYGNKFMYDSCKNFSHRLLKTDTNKRKTTVKDFVKKCGHYAKNLTLNQSFIPFLKPGILAASLLDNYLGLKIFSFYQKIKKATF